LALKLTTFSTPPRSSLKWQFTNRAASFLGFTALAYSFDAQLSTIASERVASIVLS